MINKRVVLIALLLSLSTSEGCKKSEWISILYPNLCTQNNNDTDRAEIRFKLLDMIKGE